MISTIIVAGGRGSRMGSDINKVYLKLADTPILKQTIKAFLKHKKITEIIVVYHPDDANHLKQIVESIDATCKIKIVTGGNLRTDSVRRGLSLVDDNQRYVLIHDAARPFVSQKLIEDVVLGLDYAPAVVPTIPITDTLKKVDGNRIITTIDRSTLAAAQTPQGFDKEFITKLYHQIKHIDAVFTDDVSIAEYFNYPVNRVTGDPYNIKLTTPFDMKLGELIIKEIPCE